MDDMDINDDYEYEYPSELPDGWSLAVWPDGRAMACSPGTSPPELGGHDAAYQSRDAAIATVADIIEAL